MARSYEDVVAALRPAGNPALTRFTQAVQTHFEDACSQAFALGEAVAARCAEPHLSQVQRSDRTGIPQADISRIERGKGNPTGHRHRTKTRSKPATPLHHDRAGGL